MRPDTHLEALASDARERHDPFRTAERHEAVRAIGEWMAACPVLTDIDPWVLAELAIEGTDIEFPDMASTMDDLATYSPQLNAAMARSRATQEEAA